MKTVIIAIVCLVVGFGVAYVALPGSQQTEADPHDSPKQLYTCGMHPEIISDEPGVCPICNMKLTPIRNDGNAGSGVRVDPTTRQNMGLVTAPVTYQSLSRTLSTFGKVTEREPNLHSVTLKTDGWVEKLYVAEEGEAVYAGQPLLEIYSPDLVAAQKELLILTETTTPDNSTGRLIDLARDRLRNWDISDDQLDRLINERQVSRTMKIRSPADGVVLSKMVEVGDKVTVRTVLYNIADLSTVWVEAYVYEADLPFVALGQEAAITSPSLPGQTFNAKVSFVAPVLDKKGQAEIRFTLANPDRILKPEMYTDVRMKSTLEGDRLAIPRKAVINSGERQLVFVAGNDDNYDARTVVTGAVDDGDMVEIKDGLTAGESVVVSGQFLLDSESRLSEAVGSEHHHAKPVETPAETHDHSGHQHSEADRDPYNIYTCPMPADFDVLHYGPGQCPKCGYGSGAAGRNRQRPGLRLPHAAVWCSSEGTGTLSEVQHAPGRVPPESYHD